MSAPKRILAVDDDEKVLFVVNGSLMKLGADYEVVTARDGQEALEKFRAAPFDLIITDLRMPGMDGVALTEAIRGVAPETRVIWMTAYGRHDADAQRLAVQRCLQKPLDIAEIREAALEALLPPVSAQVKRQQVLIIEDDPQEAITLYQALSKEHYVKITMLLDEALNSLRREQFDWIVTGMHIGSLNGLDFIRRAHQLSPPTRIVLLNPPESPELLGQLRALGSLTLSDLVHRPESATALCQALASLKHWRVLVLEDDESLQRLYGKAFSKAGYQVSLATTLQAARSLLAQHRFDVFVCDIHLGNEWGTDLLQEQLMTFRQNEVQVIVISGHAQYRELCNELDVDFYLEKPVTMEALLALVNRLVQDR